MFLAAACGVWAGVVRHQRTTRGAEATRSPGVGAPGAVREDKHDARGPAQPRTVHRKGGLPVRSGADAAEHRQDPVGAGIDPAQRRQEILELSDEVEQRLLRAQECGSIADSSLVEVALMVLQARSAAEAELDDGALMEVYLPLQAYDEALRQATSDTGCVDE